MGLFGYTDGDRWRELLHIYNARTNGYHLLLPENKDSISDSYYLFDSDGKTYCAVRRTDSECLRDYKQLKEWVENGESDAKKLRITKLSYIEPNILVNTLISFEIERYKNGTYKPYYFLHDYSPKGTSKNPSS